MPISAWTETVITAWQAVAYLPSQLFLLARRSLSLGPPAAEQMSLLIFNAAANSPVGILLTTMLSCVSFFKASVRRDKWGTFFAPRLTSLSCKNKASSRFCPILVFPFLFDDIQR